MIILIRSVFIFSTVFPFHSASCWNISMFAFSSIFLSPSLSLFSFFSSCVRLDSIRLSFIGAENGGFQRTQNFSFGRFASFFPLFSFLDEKKLFSFLLHWWIFLFYIWCFFASICRLFQRISLSLSLFFFLLDLVSILFSHHQLFSSCSFFVHRSSEKLFVREKSK